LIFSGICPILNLQGCKLDDIIKIDDVEGTVVDFNLQGCKQKSDNMYIDRLNGYRFEPS
jgi:hypothetical protein